MENRILMNQYCPYCHEGESCSYYPDGDYFVCPTTHRIFTQKDVEIVIRNGG